ncbi:hypothetical protein CDAR_619551 [Caerostris darwini]|uniref:Uncharacterized protein n=1 Tax=Caerostris darwini TaxID=1538125 RepID=A0AAV4QVK5_9ARAC|nr:hypothetical protein CDAR_619551 [Caerostris darwini]
MVIYCLKTTRLPQYCGLFLPEPLQDNPNSDTVYKKEGTDLVPHYQRSRERRLKPINQLSCERRRIRVRPNLITKYKIIRHLQISTINEKSRRFLD